MLNKRKKERKKERREERKNSVKPRKIGKIKKWKNVK